MVAPFTFLTAEWRHLAMLNYTVDPAVLAPYVPTGTVLDLWQERAYVSLVGFRFLDTRVLGLPLPGHRDFDEVNLRLYVRRPHPDGDRRGVVFIKEIVPRQAIAAVARWLYHENYVAAPMRHHIDDTRVEYGWADHGRWCRLAVKTTGPAAALEAGSEAEFIAEHYWGYSAWPDGSCMEYQVAHDPWQVRAVDEAVFEAADIASLYGPAFAPVLAAPPTSAFLALGSPVRVYAGQKIRPAAEPVT